MTPLLEQHPAGLHVARAHEVPDYSGTKALKRRIIRHKAPHFNPTSRISLHILDWIGRAQLKPIVPCEWLHTKALRLALCCNPYPTGPCDRWLLCRPDGVACFTATSPEIARLHFYSITGGLQAA